MIVGEFVLRIEGCEGFMDEGKYEKVSACDMGSKQESAAFELFLEEGQNVFD